MQKLLRDVANHPNATPQPPIKRERTVVNSEPGSDQDSDDEPPTVHQCSRKRLVVDSKPTSDLDSDDEIVVHQACRKKTAANVAAKNKSDRSDCQISNEAIINEVKRSMALDIDESTIASLDQPRTTRGSASRYFT